LHGRRITCLPHQDVDIDELTDPTYGETSQLRKRARIHATILSDFKKRWCHEYLTSLREYHKASGVNKQAVKKGDVVIVHNDTARATWKMAVIDDLIVGGDGLVRAATIRTSNGTTSRPITKLYPIELNEADEITTTSGEMKQPHSDSDQPRNTDHRPQRNAAKQATNKVKKWVQLYSGPPEDVTADEL